MAARLSMEDLRVSLGVIKRAMIACPKDKSYRAQFEGYAMLLAHRVADAHNRRMERIPFLKVRGKEDK